MFEALEDVEKDDSELARKIRARIAERTREYVRCHRYTVQNSDRNVDMLEMISPSDSANIQDGRDILTNKSNFASPKINIKRTKRASVVE
jgi:hypothetical protein